MEQLRSIRNIPVRISSPNQSNKFSLLQGFIKDIETLIQISDEDTISRMDDDLLDDRRFPQQ